MILAFNEGLPSPVAPPESLPFAISDFKTTPYHHQIFGVKWALEREYCALFDEMGAGKSKQAIDVSCLRWDRKDIDTVVVLCPAQVRTVWKNLVDGQIATHSWVPSWVGEFCYRTYDLLPPERVRSAGKLYWIISTYEYLSNPANLKGFLRQLKGRKYSVIADEGMFIKNEDAARTKSAITVRDRAETAMLLNGTPIGNTVVDIYSQMQFLHKSILGVKNFYHFRARFCKLGGFTGRQVIGYQNMPLLIKQVAPHVIRRLKKDCLDLPPKSYTHTDVPMGPKTWRIYREMRDQMVAWLKENDPTSSPVICQHATVKYMRLAQITSGFIGGVEDMEAGGVKTEEIGSEKLDATLDWVEMMVDNDPHFHGLIWSRFRPEQVRLVEALRKKGYQTHRIFGGQKARERQDGITEFTAKTDKPVIMVGQPQAGGFGLNIQFNCWNVLRVSRDYSVITHQQAEDRVHRPGQKYNVLYNDMFATGPDGQQTVDHRIFASIQKNEEFADWTTSHWVKSLTEEITD